MLFIRLFEVVARVGIERPFVIILQRYKRKRKTPYSFNIFNTKTFNWNKRRDSGQDGNWRIRPVGSRHLQIKLWWKIWNIEFLSIEFVCLKYFDRPVPYNMPSVPCWKNNSWHTWMMGGQPQSGKGDIGFGSLLTFLALEDESPCGRSQVTFPL